MTHEQIKFLKNLDIEGTSGTIQSVLMRDDLHTISYTKTLEFLIKTLKLERDKLVLDNIRLTKEFMKNENI